MKFSKRFGGFTMLELLAVLAIVLILSAIIFPAIESAREKSLATACGQNVKQLVLAITQFEQDRGQFPAGRRFIGTAAAVTDMTKWSNEIVAYMQGDDRAKTAMGPNTAAALTTMSSMPPGDQSVNSTTNLYPEAYRCPIASNWDVAGYNMSYGYNYQYLGNADPRSFVTGVATNKGYVNYPVTKGAIRRADRTICVADSDGTGIAGSYLSAGGGAPAPANLGAFAYLIDPTFLPARNLTGAVGGVPAAPAAGTELAPAAGGLLLTGGGPLTIGFGGVSGNTAATSVEQGVRGIVSNRHKGGANVGFLDGHVESVLRENCYLRAADQNIASNTGNALFLSNELWNGFGIDNDTNGNGTIDTTLGERILDENEAFTVAAGTALTGAVSALYDPTAPSRTGNDVVTGMAGGAYTAFGPGMNTSGSTFSQAASITIPHIPPFDISFGVAGVQ